MQLRKLSMRSGFIFIFAMFSLWCVVWIYNSNCETTINEQVSLIHNLRSEMFRYSKAKIEADERYLKMVRLASKERLRSTATMSTKITNEFPSKASSIVKSLESLSSISKSSFDEVSQIKDIPKVSSEEMRTKNLKSALSSTPTLVLTYDRPYYLRRTLQSLDQFAPFIGYHVLVSQDALDTGVQSVIDDFINTNPIGNTVSAIGRKIHVQTFVHDPEDRMKALQLAAVDGANPGYYALAHHYKSALTEVFERRGDLIDSVIIVEDDIEIACDFYDYFAATLLALKTDNSLLAISAWNDLGQQQFVGSTTGAKAEQLFRSDFFPGLGWALTRRLWIEELSVKWPVAYWDDWLRLPQHRRDRTIIRPEISRTYTFGEEGSSMGQFYQEYLKDIVLNRKCVDFSLDDKLSIVLSRKKFHDWWMEQLRNASEETTVEGVVRSSARAVRMSYSVEPDGLAGSECEKLMGQFGLMPSVKSGVPRTAYSGVVPLWVGKKRVFLYPNTLKL